MQLSSTLTRYAPSKLSTFQLSHVSPAQLKAKSLLRSFGDAKSNHTKPDESVEVSQPKHDEGHHREMYKRRNRPWWEGDSFSPFSLAPRGLFDTFFARDPFRDFDNITKSIFGDVLGSKRPSADKDIFQWRPKADMKETKEGYVIQAELPGVPKENLKVEINQDTLTLRGDKKYEVSNNGDEAEEFQYRERSYGSFMRRFQLPEGVDAKKIKANFHDGVLKLEIPKTEQSRESITVPID